MYSSRNWILLLLNHNNNKQIDFQYSVLVVLDQNNVLPSMYMYSIHKYTEFSVLLPYHWAVLYG